MEQKNYELHLLFEIVNSEIHKIENGKFTLLNKGALGIYELKEMNLIVLKLNDWQYSLNKENPVMSQQDLQRKIYIFPQQNFHFGIVLGSNAQRDLYDCFESILYNNANFIVPDVTAMNQEAQEQVKQAGKKEDDDDHSYSKKIGSFLSKGGDFIKEGLISGAQLLSEGIVKGGHYIKTKIKKPEKITVEPSTMMKVKAANTTSSAMLTYTQQQVQALMSAGKIVAKEVGNTIESSETGQKITGHKNWEDAKNVGKGTLHAVVSVYDGMFEALCVIGRGFQTATTEVVSYKYGQDAGQVAHDSMDCVGNIGQITRVYKDAAIKEISKETSDKNPQMANNAIRQ